MSFKYHIVLFILLAINYEINSYARLPVGEHKVNDFQTDDWQFRNVSGIPFSIGLNLVDTYRLPAQRHLYIYVEPKNFRIENIKLIIKSLSEEFDNPQNLGIFFRSNPLILKNWISYQLNIYCMKTQNKASICGTGMIEGLDDLNCYRADYVRSRSGEVLYYYYENGSNNSMRIRLRSISTHDYTGDVNADLIRAAMNGHLKRIKKCLTDGANVNAKDMYGYTPLVNAVLWEQAKAVDLLLKKGADPNLSGPDGWTPLMCAIAKGYDTVADKLLPRLNYIDEKNANGETPLMLAVSSGRKVIVEELLRRGAEINVINIFGKTILMIAEEKENKEIIQLLNKHEAFYKRR